MRSVFPRGPARGFVGSRRWTIVVVAVATTLMMVSASFGLHVPGLGFLSPFSQGSALDYSTGPATLFQPLDPRFVASVLGGGFPELQTVATRGRQGSRSDRLPVDGPVVVQHAFTNDDFDRAYTISSTPFTAQTFTRGASREPNESTQCGRNGTVWYRYTAADDRALLADTFGSNYAVALGVFRATPAGLELIGCDTSRLGNAQVSFESTRGATYYLRIAREVAPSGNTLVFHLAPLGVTNRASVATSGSQVQGLSSIPFSSRDGHYVAFDSDARKLVPHQNVCVSALSVPPTACDDVYVRDQRSGTTTIASVSSTGAFGNDTSFFPSLSGDGRYVAFTSNASNLVPGDTNALPDTFVHDLRTGSTIRVSVSSSGAQGYVDKVPGILSDPVSLHELFPQSMISENGRYVAFESRATGFTTPDQVACGAVPLGPHDVHCRDIYVKDLVTGRIELVSDPGNGERANNDSLLASISADGRYVSFLSVATNLVAGETGPIESHIYLRDLRMRKTSRVSVSSTGEPGNGSSIVISISNQISADGRYVVFGSLATNLAPGDDSDYDIFVHDTKTGKTVLATVSSAGEQKNGQDTTGRYSISDDGRYVVFDSTATNLVPGDTNGRSDVFVHDLITGATTRVSLSSLGRQGDGDSREACGSPDGRAVVFSSTAKNLVDGDTNGDQDIYVHTLPR